MMEQNEQHDHSTLEEPLKCPINNPETEAALDAATLLLIQFIVEDLANGIDHTAGQVRSENGPERVKEA